MLNHFHVWKLIKIQRFEKRGLSWLLLIDLTIYLSFPMKHFCSQNVSKTCNCSIQSTKNKYNFHQNSDRIPTECAYITKLMPAIACPIVSLCRLVLTCKNDKYMYMHFIVFIMAKAALALSLSPSRFYEIIYVQYCRIALGKINFTEILEFRFTETGVCE